jgi:hypothetical protein
MKWASHVAHMSKMRNAYKIFVKKPEGRVLGGYSGMWVNNIQIDFK